MRLHENIQKWLQKKQQQLKKFKQREKERVCGFKGCSYFCLQTKMTEHELDAHKGVFACQYDRAFSQKGTLEHHKQRFHNNLIFQSKGQGSIFMGCRKMFRRSESLKGHMKNCRHCGEEKTWEELLHSQKLNKAETSWLEQGERFHRYNKILYCLEFIAKYVYYMQL